MSGFIEPNNRFFLDRIIQNIKKISHLGMFYDDLVIKNSQAIGVTESEFLKKGGIKDDTFLYNLRRTDTFTKQYIGYFDKDLNSKRQYLQQFSLNPEIEFILDTICDEAIVYDEENFWAYLSPIEHELIDEEKNKQIQKRYKEIYNLFGFNQGVLAWHYFRKFLVEGLLAFEIVFDEKGKNIIGFKELDAGSLVPNIEKDTDGNLIDIWIQYPDNPRMTRKLYDSQIIYISYGKGSLMPSRISYTERLIRSFNLLRIMEHTRIIWNVMNSSYRLTMTVPVGTRSPQKAKQTLGELMSIYKEDIRLNYDSGELLIDGRPKIQFFKNYLIPSSHMGTTDIEPLPGSGNAQAFSDTSPLQYFANKLRMDSKIPITRFGREESDSSGTITFSSEGIEQEEIRFSKFINRLRSIFQEILIKPLWVQFCLDYPELKKDYLIKIEFGLNYVKENIFQKFKENEIMIARQQQIMQLMELKNSKGKSYFSLEFLINKYLRMSPDDLAKNKKMKEQHEKENKKKNENENENEENFNFKI